MRVHHVLTAAASLLLAVVSTGPASAQIDAGATDDADGQVSARFVRDSVLYPSSPDGWICWFLGSCRLPGERTDRDPAPIALVRDGQSASLICVFGSYAKLTLIPDASPPRDHAAAAPSSAPPTPAAPPTRPDSSTIPAEPAPPTAAIAPTPVAGAPTVADTTQNPTATTASPSSRPEPATAAPMPTTADGITTPTTDQVTAWAPVEDVDPVADAKPRRCSIDQWA